MFPRDYRRIINEDGRRKLGHPYIACFKSCVSLIAQEMAYRNHFKADDKFAVILDRNDHETVAVDVFYKMKDSLHYPFHRRLAACAPGGWEEHVALQAADLIAYETFRILGEKYKGQEAARPFLQRMFGTNGFLGYYFEPNTFEEIKGPMADIDPCIDNGFVMNFPSVVPPDEGRELYRDTMAV